MTAATHGMTNSPEYRTWTDMKTRCCNPNATGYPRYGGRGVRVCRRWRRSFTAFFKDMGPKPSPDHSIDRIDNNGHYEPGNCRWATDKDQARNKSTTILVEVDGETKALSELAEITGIKYGTLYYRYQSGFRGEDLIGKGCMVVTHNGISDTLSGWSRRTGIPATTINMRLRAYGWPVGRAVTEGVSN